MKSDLSRADSQRGMFIVALAWVVAAGSLLLGLGSVVAAAAVLAVPVAAFVLRGRNLGRGAIIGCVALAVGSTLIRHAPGAFPGVELALLGCLAVTSLLGGTVADRLATASPAALAVSPEWSTIIVGCERLKHARIIQIRQGIASRYDELQILPVGRRPAKRDQRRHSKVG